MKKQTPSTFMLNTNDMAFFFVEGKYSYKYGPVYHVYYNPNEKPVLYSAENFVEVHGAHEKESLRKFTERALFDLTVLNGSNPKINHLYNIFHKTHDLVINQDKKKPKLGKLKTSFIKAVSSYNESKDLLPSNINISYEEDYELVTNKTKQHVKNISKSVAESERKQVKKIVTGIDSEPKVIQRKLKHD